MYRIYSALWTYLIYGFVRKRSLSVLVIYSVESTRVYMFNFEVWYSRLPNLSTEHFLSNCFTFTSDLFAYQKVLWFISVLCTRTLIATTFMVVGILSLSGCPTLLLVYFYIPLEPEKPGGHNHHNQLIPHHWPPFNGDVPNLTARILRAT